MTRLLFIPGSLRQASSSRAMVRTLAKRLGDSVTVEVADPGALPLYNADLADNPNVASFIAEVGAADGVIFVTPEYNYSIPGVLKNAIDWASRPAFESVFKGKPCMVISLSGGALGGVRAQAHLKYVLDAMLARVFSCREIVVPMANAKVEDGLFTDETVLAFADENVGDFVKSLH